MASRNTVVFMDIRTFVHATEDEDKVQQALHNTLPRDYTEALAFRRTNLAGHYGNPIMLLQTRIKDRSILLATLEKLASELGVMDKETLNDEILQHVERGNLYVRLDKQAAFEGIIKFHNVDPIRLRIHFKKPSLEDVIKTCRGFGLIP